MLRYRNFPDYTVAAGLPTETYVVCQIAKEKKIPFFKPANGNIVRGIKDGKIHKLKWFDPKETSVLDRPGGVPDLELWAKNMVITGILKRGTKVEARLVMNPKAGRWNVYIDHIIDEEEPPSLLDTPPQTPLVPKQAMPPPQVVTPSVPRHSSKKHAIKMKALSRDCETLRDVFFEDVFECLHEDQIPQELYIEATLEDGYIAAIPHGDDMECCTHFLKIPFEEMDHFNQFHSVIKKPIDITFLKDSEQVSVDIPDEGTFKMEIVGVLKLATENYYVQSVDGDVVMDPPQPAVLLRPKEARCFYFGVDTQVKLSRLTKISPIRKCHSLRCGAYVPQRYVWCSTCGEAMVKYKSKLLKTCPNQGCRAQQPDEITWNCVTCDENLFIDHTTGDMITKDTCLRIRGDGFRILAQINWCKIRVTDAPEEEDDDSGYDDVDGPMSIRKGLFCMDILCMMNSDQFVIADEVFTIIRPRMESKDGRQIRKILKKILTSHGMFDGELQAKLERSIFVADTISELRNTRIREKAHRDRA